MKRNCARTSPCRTPFVMVKGSDRVLHRVCWLQAPPALKPVISWSVDLLIQLGCFTFGRFPRTFWIWRRSMHLHAVGSSVDVLGKLLLQKGVRTCSSLHCWILIWWMESSTFLSWSCFSDSAVLWWVVAWAWVEHSWSCDLNRCCRCCRRDSFLQMSEQDVIPLVMFSFWTSEHSQFCWSIWELRVGRGGDLLIGTC